MNRIRLGREDRFDRAAKQLTVRDPHNIGHLQVLRIRKGEQVAFLDIEAGALVTAVSREDTKRGGAALIFDAVAERPLEIDPVAITLFQGIPKGSKLDAIVRQTTEVGVAAIVPLSVERCVGEQVRVDRLQRIAEEAALQARRDTIPSVDAPMNLDMAIRAMATYDAVILLYEEAVTPLREVLRCPRFGSAARRCDVARSRGEAMPLSEKIPVRIALVVGPEGGFERAEVERMRDELGDRAAVVSLGKRILRTETVGIAAIAAILYEWEV